MDKNRILKAVVGQISNMLDNNYLVAPWPTPERFLGWCQDGEVFDLDNSIPDDEKAEAVAFAEKVAPLVDALTRALDKFLEDQKQ